MLYKTLQLRATLLLSNAGRLFFWTKAKPNTKEKGPKKGLSVVLISSFFPPGIHLTLFAEIPIGKTAVHRKLPLGGAGRESQGVHNSESSHVGLTARELQKRNLLQIDDQIA
ncbi:hypothetical protein CDAR_91631 [Caerostris darwini]|uniref:Uncharacterized protein n=1 Tax=Caerostris darwini TaxID=1538125 RepID=A0AAV4Q8J5_9ARAC|nr:hypothetical protein CDAR_91631 [Caerostris darwini]